MRFFSTIVPGNAKLAVFARLDDEGKKVIAYSTRRVLFWGTLDKEEGSLIRENIHGKALLETNVVGLVLNGTGTLCSAEDYPIFVGYVDENFDELGQDKEKVILDMIETRKCVGMKNIQFNQADKNFKLDLDAFKEFLVSKYGDTETTEVILATAKSISKDYFNVMIAHDASEIKLMTRNLIKNFLETNSKPKQ